VSSNPGKGPLVDAEPARQHARQLMAGGVSIKRLALAAGVGQATVTGILYRRATNRPRATRIRQVNADRILAVQAQDIVTGRVEATGTRRRLQALMAAGWPLYRVAPYIDRHPHYVTEILRCNRVYSTTAHAVAVAYNQLWNQDPATRGVLPGTAKRVRNYALANSWAPPAAWDDDQIDNPAAAPEWTGHCGSDRGWWTHRLQSLPMCPHCEEAHGQWKRDHAHLTTRERWTALRHAQAAASSRGSDIAEDGRELLRFGCDYDTAAERLGVTRQHLQQELVRHPAGAVA
jgi:hypothetical protein